MKTSSLNETDLVTILTIFALMNDEINQNLFQQGGHQILRHYLPSSISPTNPDELLVAVERYDSVAAKLLHQLRQAENIHHYIKYDKELRIKVPDIWKMELDRAAHNLMACLHQLKVYSNEIGLKFEVDTDTIL